MGKIANGGRCSFFAYRSKRNLNSAAIIDFPVYFGTVADISGVVGKNSVDCVRVALMRFDDCFIGEKFTHSVFPP